MIGLDADASAMAEASRRAAAPPSRGGVPNARFLAASAEELPGPLVASAHQITICLPWGSLLHGLLVADQALVSGIAGTLRSNGEVEIVLSTTARDAVAHGHVLESAADAVAFAGRLEHSGLQVIDCRPAGRSDVERLSSGWGKRLGIPERRPGWLFVGRQDGPGGESASRSLM